MAQVYMLIISQVYILAIKEVEAYKQEDYNQVQNFTKATKFISKQSNSKQLINQNVITKKVINSKSKATSTVIKNVLTNSQNHLLSVLKVPNLFKFV